MRIKPGCTVYMIVPREDQLLIEKKICETGLGEWKLRGVMHDNNPT